MTKHSGDDFSSENWNTKKVRFKPLDLDVNNAMVVDSTPAPGVSWRDKVLGRGVFGSGCDEEFEFLEGDVMRSNVNGILTINFSERVQQILVKDMVTTVVVKFLDQNLSYTLLQNKIHNLSKPLQQFHLMDVENGYFLAFPSNTMVWVRLPGLSGYLYKRYILEEIESLIGKVTKLDFETDKGSRGKFARMAVYINLEKPSVSQILVNGVVHRVVFESLPSVCFSYGRFDHLQNLCFGSDAANDTKMGTNVTAVASLEKNNMAELTKAFGPWMLVERKYRRNPRTRQNLDKETTENDVVIPNIIKTTDEREPMVDLSEEGLVFGVVKNVINDMMQDVNACSVLRNEFSGGLLPLIRVNILMNNVHGSIIKDKHSVFARVSSFRGWK
ncbi:hypothetical protein Golax_025577 [Gossypium laxum]|uniref:DUF4283 domain-containing protein n=1 Tax=Gossypium laxum TaxID=34288 RepID=A0A7J9B1X1_9ROSI|nr:hypothetical protein [Gossypium laxum]